MLRFKDEEPSGMVPRIYLEPSDVHTLQSMTHWSTLRFEGSSR